LGRLKPFGEIKRRLEAPGFVETSQKGSHVTLAGFGETVDVAIVPNKPEVPTGTLRSILSQARIDPGDWDELG